MWGGGGPSAGPSPAHPASAPALPRRRCCQVCRQRSEVHSLERAALLACASSHRLPCLVATGRCDPVSPPAAAARLAERLGGAAPQLAVLPACGHLSFEEAPAELAGLLAAWLRSALQRMQPCQSAME